MADYFVRTAGGSWNQPATYSTDPALRAAGAAATTTPGPTDTIWVDANSGNLTSNSTSITPGGLIFADGYTGTWANNTASSIMGSLRLSAGMTITGGGTLTLAGSGAHTLRSNGKNLGRNLTFNGTGSYTLEDALDLGSSVLALPQGTLNTSNFSVTAGSFNSIGSLSRTWNFGTSTFNLSLSNVTAWQISGSGITGNAADITVNFTGSNVTFASLNIPVGHVVATGIGHFTVSPNATTVKTLTRQCDFNGVTLVLANGLNVSEGLFLLGLERHRLTVHSSAFGVTRGLIATAVGVPMRVEHASFQDTVLASSGGGSWASPVVVGNVGDAGNNDFAGLLTPAPSITLTPAASSNRWEFFASNWNLYPQQTPAPRWPLPQDDVVLSDENGTVGDTTDYTTTGAYSFLCRNLTITHPTKTYVIASTGLIRSVLGNFYVAPTAAGIICLPGGTLEVRAAFGNSTVEATGNNVWCSTFYLRAGNNQISLANNTRLNAFVDHESGTINFPANLWIEKFQCEGNRSGKVVNMAGTHLRLLGVGTVWGATTGSSRVINVDANTILDVLDDSMTNKTITTNAGGIASAMAAATVRYTVDAPNSTLTYTQGAMALDVQGPDKTVLFGGAATTRMSRWRLHGTAESPIQLRSTTAGTVRSFNWIQAVADTVEMRYVAISDVSASAAVTAYDSSGTNTTGFTFSAGPPPFSPPTTTDYTIPSYVKMIQRHNPSWYISGDTGHLVVPIERGPAARAVSSNKRVVYTQPVVKTGLSLSLLDHQLSVSYSTSDNSNRRTYEFWVRTTATTSQTVLNRGTGSTTRMEGVHLAPDGRVEVRHFLATNSGSYDVVMGSKAINDGKPHHVVVTMNNSTKATTIWVDGVVDATGSFTNVVSHTSPTLLAANVGPQQFFVGSLDEIAFYTYDFDAARVSEHYEFGSKVVAGLVKVMVGGQWVKKPAKVLLGGVWTAKPVKHNSTGAWTPVA